MQLKLYKKDLDNNKGSGGLEIKIEGVKGDPSEVPPGTSVFIEDYEGKVWCRIWTNNQQDCQSIELT